LGTLASGYLAKVNKTETGTDWFGFWIVPSVVLFIALGFFMVFFKSKSSTTTNA
jgi:hypothetical protein